MKPLLIRADASAQMGTGHVMRCVALAQAWRDAGGRVGLACAPGAGALLGRLQSEAIEIATITVEPGSLVDARATAELAQRAGARWVVADGYHFDAEYQDALKQAGLSLLFVDDNGHASHYSADLVLNPNLHACEAMYRGREGYTRLLLGPQYALLRREFLPRQERRREFREAATRLLVTLGGADHANITRKVIQAVALLSLPGLETQVVVGSLDANRKGLEREVKRCSGKIHLRADQAKMEELMAWAECAVAGAGSTSWELCFMGVPSLLIVVAENQRRTGEELARREAAVNLGGHEQITPRVIAARLLDLLTNKELRARLAGQAQGVTDGQGPARIVTQMQAGFLELRRAGPEDCKLLWEWANDAQVRMSSFSSSPIPWEQHVQWFGERLSDPRCFLFVGMDGDGAPVGQVRFEVKAEGDAVVHVSVDPVRRGCGYGRLLVSRCLEEVPSAAAVRLVHAYIKPENSTSKRAFESAGFREVGSEEGPGGPALHYVKECASNGDR